jgi:hypothetical protein
MGILVIWTYAAIRPRFGPGPRTAVRAALIPFIGITLVLAGFTSMGVFPTAVFLKGTAFSLINMALGAVVGAWAYSEV